MAGALTHDSFMTMTMTPVILCAEYFPTTPEHITAHADILLGGPVLCPSLFRLLISHPGVGGTNLECWVITG